MIFPVIQKVTDDLVCALEKVRKSGGATIDLAVEVASFVPESIGDNDAVAIFNFEDLQPLDESPIGFTDRSLNFRIAVLVRTSDKSQIKLHARMLNAAAAVERAVLADVTRTGNAIDTDLTAGAVIDARHEGYYGIDLYVGCHVRTQIGEPFDFQPSFTPET